MFSFLLPILKRPLPGHTRTYTHTHTHTHTHAHTRTHTRTHAHTHDGWMDGHRPPPPPSTSGSKSRRETSVSCDLNILALNKKCLNRKIWGDCKFLNGKVLVTVNKNAYVCAFRCTKLDFTTNYILNPRKYMKSLSTFLLDYWRSELLAWTASNLV